MKLLSKLSKSVLCSIVCIDSSNIVPHFPILFNCKHVDLCFSFFGHLIDAQESNHVKNFFATINLVIQPEKVLGRSFQVRKVSLPKTVLLLR